MRFPRVIITAETTGSRFTNARCRRHHASNTAEVTTSQWQIINYVCRSPVSSYREPKTWSSAGVITAVWERRWRSTTVTDRLGFNVCCRTSALAGARDVMGNQLCAPWRKGYREDEHQWTPRKDSHLLRYAITFAQKMVFSTAALLP